MAADYSRNFDVNDLISISNDLVKGLKDPPNDRELNILFSLFLFTLPFLLEKYLLGFGELENLIYLFRLHHLQML
ncbi:transmembrane protein, putative [Medicago truncatula]|uniref:Transmembrane protein, putative n=1 Tax=Medicago truncatula TaxID=3880 RepID=G7KT62_MEDTR|nr:transmembrane protein, putative [Medicago truncatula]